MLKTRNKYFRVKCHHQKYMKYDYGIFRGYNITTLILYLLKQKQKIAILPLLLKCHIQVDSLI